MAISISNSISLLQTLHGGITGVKLAPTVYRGSINTAQLPFVITWPAPAETTYQTLKAYQSLRTYSVRCFVEPVGQNNIDAPIQEAITLLERFLDTYMNNSTLSDGVTLVQSVDDTGVFAGATTGEELIYSGNFYVGFVCRVILLEQSDIL